MRGYCDPRSLEFAKALAQGLRRHAPVEIVAPRNRQSRRVLDYNRREARQSAYRQRLARAMSEANVLLDVHSFDAAEDFDLPAQSNVELVILDLAQSAWSPLALALAESAAELGFVVALLLGADEQDANANDVLIEARQAALPAALLEVRSDLAPRRLRALGKLLARSLSTQ